MLNIAVAGVFFSKLLHRRKNLFALRQIGSKREARDGGCLGAALQFINGIVDSIQIDCAL